MGRRAPNLTCPAIALRWPSDGPASARGPNGEEMQAGLTGGGKSEVSKGNCNRLRIDYGGHEIPALRNMANRARQAPDGALPVRPSDVDLPGADRRLAAPGGRRQYRSARCDDHAQWDVCGD